MSFSPVKGEFGVISFHGTATGPAIKGIDFGTPTWFMGSHQERNGRDTWAPWQRGDVEIQFSTRTARRTSVLTMDMNDVYLKIPNLRLQWEIQRQREEEKRWKTRDRDKIRRKEQADREKKGSENTLAFELSETDVARPRRACVRVCVCGDIIQGGAESELQPCWRQM